MKSERAPGFVKIRSGFVKIRSSQRSLFDNIYTSLAKVKGPSRNLKGPARNSKKPAKQPKQNKRQTKRARSRKSSLSARETQLLDQIKVSVLSEYGPLFRKLGLSREFERCLASFTGDMFRNLIGKESLTTRTQMINAERAVSKLLFFFVYSTNAIYGEFNAWTRGRIPNTFPPPATHRSQTSPWSHILYKMLYAWMDTHGYRKIVNEAPGIYYRGDSYERRLNSGDYFFCEQFWSSSENEGVAKNFAVGGIVYHIRDTAGVLPMPLAEISSHQHEKEYLFPPGTFFRVTRVTEGTGPGHPTTIHLDTIGFCPEVCEPALGSEYGGFIGRFQYNQTIPRHNTAPSSVPSPRTDPSPMTNLAPPDESFSLFSWKTALTLGTLALGMYLGSSKKTPRERKRKSKRKSKRERNLQR